MKVYVGRDVVRGTSACRWLSFTGAVPGNAGLGLRVRGAATTGGTLVEERGERCAKVGCEAASDGFMEVWLDDGADGDSGGSSPAGVGA